MLRLGDAVEGNEWISALFSNKPSLAELLIYEGLFDVALISLTLWMVVLQLPWFTLGAIACVVKGVLHVRGALRWRRLK